MNKIFKILTIAAVTVVCGVFATGCLKGYNGDVVYVLKPLVSDGSYNEDVERYITAYAFNADTLHWTVASYEDALAKRITEKSTGRTQTSPLAVSSPFVESVSDGHYSVSMTLPPDRTLMLVVVDTELKQYGYRQQKLTEGLTSIFETVIFYTSRNALRYKAGQWLMCNDFYVAPEPEEPENPEGGDNGEGGENEGDNGDENGGGDNGGDNEDDNNGEDNNGEDNDGGGNTPSEPAEPENPENPDTPDTPDTPQDNEQTKR